MGHKCACNKASLLLLLLSPTYTTKNSKDSGSAAEPQMGCLHEGGSSRKNRKTIIIIMAGMAVFYVAGYLIEERRRWPVITASPRGQRSK